MSKISDRFKSIRLRLFLTISTVIIIVIFLLILINSVVLEGFYLYSKTKTVKNIYEQINAYYNNPNTDINIENQLKYMAQKNNLEILIKTNEDTIILTTDIQQAEYLGRINIHEQINKNECKGKIVYQKNNVLIEEGKEENNNLTYMSLSAILDNNYQLYIRTPISSIKESVSISNKVLLIIGGAAIVISAMFASVFSKRFTNPIIELNGIAKKMSNLDFSQKYTVDGSDDEIDNLGKSINSMSDKLEKTIKQLKTYNNELEKDIEKKSKIDDMRKQFISDVSHELKTPISLIQGYAEGLIENVNTDDQSRKYYSEVILDEANKMDKLVKQLLELMKLEYDNRILNNKEFDIVSLIKEVIRKYNIIIQEEGIQVEGNFDNIINVHADDFYIEQVVTNYITNAIKYSEGIDKQRIIKIKIEEIKDKVRVTVFNTGKPIDEDNLQKIWGRFYKIDTSRNREQGGTGIGLAYVKAVMNNYQNDYRSNQQRKWCRILF